MRVLGLAGMAPGPNTSRPHPEHKIYPYLLRGVAVVRPNQVWSTDITYIRLEHGFAYLVAVIDWYARRVLAWRISNTLEAGFCVDCLEDALRTHGRPEVFNSDQGSQLTREAFTGVLRRSGHQGGGESVIDGTRGGRGGVRRTANTILDAGPAAFPRGVHGIRGAVAQGLVGPLAVVEGKVLGQPQQ